MLHHGFRMQFAKTKKRTKANCIRKVYSHQFLNVGTSLVCEKFTVIFLRSFGTNSYRSFHKLSLK
ncbi:hypothetical protein LBK6_01090 [Leptospira borgpetersenii serovar Hardjo]|nr:hypothetical protein LBK6_01090 [Leptospira borgpetersenii serovar Hardjo]AWV68964.1 hypothetical protein B9T54_01205 [Leptospira borgpetersenii serovar Hardjo-bovis]TQE54120.1 hypothetical protein FFZ95_04755 [Leptospira borgpetersenii]AMX60271.1 hypothetical protein LBK9_01090 [Leptospira borgpetersenii serovar Hardjo]AMX63518.1 hypothetical protein LBK30_01105 [Leptospira borgpetersenii serovar Hardjo]